MLLPETPFQAKLGTNYAPSDTEIATINRIVIYVDALAAQFEPRIETHKANQAICSAFSAAHRILLSPIRRVPADILTTIFLLCIDPTNKSNMTAEGSPLLFTRVCHQWRELAIGTPSLWASISIHIPAYPCVYSAHGPLMRNVAEEEEELLDVEDEDEMAVALEMVRNRWQRKIEGDTELVRLWLERGKECPLSVSITIDDDLLSAPGERLLSLICKHASRWTHLELFCFNPVPGEILSLTASQVIQLRSFSMRWRSRVNEQATHAFSHDGFTNAPTLRHLCLHYPEVILDTLPVQWGNITEVSLLGGSSYRPRGITPSIASAVLKKCPALRRCELKLQDEPPALPVSTEAPGRVFLPHLRQLVICESGQKSNSTHTFFDSLDVPSIHCLALRSPRHIWMDEERPVEPPIFRLLQRWGDRLRSFDFGYCRIRTVANLIRALELTPNVEDLTVDLSEIHTGAALFDPFDTYDGFSKQQSLPFRNVFLRNLEAGTAERPQPLCPNLRVAKFFLLDCAQIAAKVVARIVSSRREEAGTVQLESLVVRFQRVLPYWKEGSHASKEKWGPPPTRWQESKLNARALAGRVIHVEWPNVNEKGVSDLGTAPDPKLSGRVPFESWWDSQSAIYCSYVSSELALSCPVV
ncbi:hypothetical protein BKA70DRAFT_1319264 [Coprinopsis sp. MPI-PUGE-AT-0042]|nr:hypothetical protein BKA70DRAFT_1319264 [Coprinopsis sp. MPI-PUGE-AT-0042]